MRDGLAFKKFRGWRICCDAGLQSETTQAHGFLRWMRMAVALKHQFGCPMLPCCVSVYVNMTAGWVVYVARA